jgi:hypothetical protein
MELEGSLLSSQEPITGRCPGRVDKVLWWTVYVHMKYGFVFLKREGKHVYMPVVVNTHSCRCVGMISGLLITVAKLNMISRTAPVWYVQTLTWLKQNTGTLASSEHAICTEQTRKTSQAIPPHLPIVVWVAVYWWLELQSAYVGQRNHLDNISLFLNITEQTNGNLSVEEGILAYEIIMLSVCLYF